MYFYTQDQILYPAFWDYSFNLILNELAAIVNENGGKVQPHKFNTGLIVNRTLLEAIDKKKDDFESFKRFFADMHKDGKMTNDEYTRRIDHMTKEYTKELQELDAIENNPVKANYPDYIIFTLDGVYYYLNYSDAQFCYVCNKQKVRDGGIISKDVYSTEISGAFWDGLNTTDFYNKELYAEKIKQAAQKLYTELLECKFGGIYRESHKTRVPNRYNSGYHYETIFAKERTEKIDF